MMILGMMYMLCLQQFNELQIREGKNGTNIVHEHELYTVIFYIYNRSSSSSNAHLKQAMEGEEWRRTVRKEQ
jgi:hypothetical protein